MSEPAVRRGRRRAPRGSGEQLRGEILDATTELLLETGHMASGIVGLDAGPQQTLRRVIDNKGVRR